MTLTRRDRRQWRMFFRVLLISVVISGCFGLINRNEGDSPWRSMLEGIANAIVIATPILFVELTGANTEALKRWRRLPLAVYFASKLLFYILVIVGGIVMMRFVFTPDAAHFLRFDDIFRRSLLFAVAISVIFNLIFDIGALLGFGTLKNLLTGRYVQPRREQRAFLLIDMRDSTGMAERLGAIRFHELLNDFFRDVADGALECEAEIHKYVGDEAILTWPEDRGLAEGDCLRCPFIVRDRIEHHRAQYLARFGVVPTFRAAIHCGEIVAGEIGDLRREIAYVGHTLNVTARLLEAAKELGHDLLVSADLLARAPLPADLTARKLPTLSVRGRAEPLEIAALDRGATA